MNEIVVGQEVGLRIDEMENARAHLRYVRRRMAAAMQHGAARGDYAAYLQTIDRAEDGLTELISAFSGGPGMLVMDGEGLGQPLSPEEGVERLRSRSAVEPLADWAGALARPSALAERLDISRATLDSWRQEGVVIALPRGRRAHVYPLEQFASGRPLPGLKPVIETVRDHVVAWRWLRSPHADFGGRPPLDVLIEGRQDEVAAAAARSFG